MRDEYFIDSLHPEARVQYLIEQKMPLNKGDVVFLIGVSEENNLRQRLMRQLLQSDLEMSVLSSKCKCNFEILTVRERDNK